MQISVPTFSYQETLISQSRIEGIAQAVADEIVAKDGKEYHEAGKDCKPPGSNIGAGFIEYTTPCNDIRRNAETEEREGCLDQDRSCNAECGCYQHRSQ